MFRSVADDPGEPATRPRMTRAKASGERRSTVATHYACEFGSLPLGLGLRLGIILSRVPVCARHVSAVRSPRRSSRSRVRSQPSSSTSEPAPGSVGWALRRHTAHSSCYDAREPCARSPEATARSTSAAIRAIITTWSACAAVRWKRPSCAPPPLRPNSSASTVSDPRRTRSRSSARARAAHELARHPCGVHHARLHAARRRDGAEAAPRATHVDRSHRGNRGRCRAVRRAPRVLRHREGLNTPTGVLVFIAVVTHDFADGLNTVGFILRQGGDAPRAFRWLTVDAVAPLIGAIVGASISVSEHTLGQLLAVYAGFFLYMGATDLLPEAHSHPSRVRVVLTVAGMASTYVVA